MSEKKEKITTEAAKKEKNNAPAKKAVDFKAVGAKVKKFFKDFKTFVKLFFSFEFSATRTDDVKTTSITIFINDIAC